MLFFIQFSLERCGRKTPMFASKSVCLSRDSPSLANVEETVDSGLDIERRF